MNNDAKLFLQKFDEVRARGFVISNRTGNTGIGKTLEDYMQVKENNSDTPDLHNFEIKSHRELCTSYVTLFTKAPTMPKRANTFLRENFGSPDTDFPKLKVLHSSFFHSRFTTNSKSGFSYKLETNDNEEKLYLLVKKTDSDLLVSNNIYWSYTILQKVINTKMQNLAFITAERKYEGANELFHFTKCVLFTGLNFERFLNFLKQDNIMFDIRIGAYKSGKLFGRNHDHGSGFRVKSEMIQKLYNELIEI